MSAYKPAELSILYQSELSGLLIVKINQQGTFRGQQRSKLSGQYPLCFSRTLRSLIEVFSTEKAALKFQRDL